MLISGTITKINNDLRYGFIKCPKIGDVFFSSDTNFTGTSFENLKVDQKVQLEVTETERGLFAKMVSVKNQRPLEKSPEAAL